MGILFKFILFGVVIYYIFKTIGGFVFRILGGRMQQYQQQQRPKTDQKKEGEIHIDYAPKDGKRKNQSGAKGGEYIDYEEVK